MAFNFDNVEEGRGVDLLRKKMSTATFQWIPWNIVLNHQIRLVLISNYSVGVNNNSRSVGGASMEETDRVTFSHARSETPSGLKHHKKKENKTIELCDAINNVAEATREKLQCCERKLGRRGSTLSRMRWKYFPEWMLTGQRTSKQSRFYINQSVTQLSF